MDGTGDDLEYREERTEPAKTVKKIHIPLKLKSSRKSNPISVKLGTPQKSTNVGEIEKASMQSNDASIQSSSECRNEDLGTKKRSMSTNEFKPEVAHKRSHTVANLNWNLNISSSCKTVVDQTMDFCMICNLPILIYGRLIPCKHVMCLQCANSIEIRVCLKESCNERIDRIEKAMRGSIFVCLHDLDFKNVDLIRQNPDISQKKLCGRSYMSQRDLNSHMQHRHSSSMV